MNNIHLKVLEVLEKQIKENMNYIEEKREFIAIPIPPHCLHDAYSVSCPECSYLNVIFLA